MKKMLPLLLLVASVAVALPAYADDPGSTTTTTTTTTSSSSGTKFPPWMQDGKSGNWMFNFKLGPALNAYAGVTQGVFAFELGYAVTPDHNGYVTFAPQFQVSAFWSWIIIPFGFQYDIPIKSVPGLYLSPAASLGYAAGVGGFCGGCGVPSAFYFEPSFSGKFIFAKRWNVGFEPFSLPVFIFSNPALNPNGTVTGGATAVVSYRILVYGGLNF